jgi:hypothetical protein
MKGVWGKSLIVVALMVFLVLLLTHERRPAMPDPAPVPPVPPAPDATPAATNLHVQPRNVGVRKPNLTPEERAELAKKFNEQLKPVVENWCRAYSGHLPVRPEEFTLDKFKERMGMSPSFYIYTFMLDGITLSVRDCGGRVAVMYMHAPAAKQLMALPQGAMPKLRLPVAKADIIRMVKADSGTQFKPDEVIVRPTGVATAINGGAFVDIGPLGGDPNNGLSKLSLVFGADGNIIYYDRDPFF